MVGVACSARCSTARSRAARRAGTAPLPSIAIADPVTARGAAGRSSGAGGLLVSSLLGVFAAVALGAWAARHRLLDEPARHRRLLRPVAVGGLRVAVLGGLPLALAAAGCGGPASGCALLPGPCTR